MTYVDMLSHESRRADSAERKLATLKEQIPTLERRLATLEARKGGISAAGVQNLIASVAPAIREFVAEEIAKALEGTMRYRGLFQRTEQYVRGDAITCDGSLWFCLKDVAGADGKPGSDEAASGWQIVTKTR